MQYLTDSKLLLHQNPPSQTHVGRRVVSYHLPPASQPPRCRVAALRPRASQISIMSKADRPPSVSIISQTLHPPRRYGSSSGLYAERDTCHTHRHLNFVFFFSFLYPMTHTVLFCILQSIVCLFFKGRLSVFSLSSSRNSWSLNFRASFPHRRCCPFLFIPFADPLRAFYGK